MPHSGFVQSDFRHAQAATEWLLAEAKANLEELFSNCGAKDGDSIKLIRATLNHVKGVLGAPGASDWVRPYYQYCN